MEQENKVDCGGVGEDGLCGVHAPGTPGCVNTLEANHAHMGGATILAPATAVAVPTDEQMQDMALDRAAQAIREVASAIAISSVAKLALKPKDMLILKSDRLDQETIAYLADVLSLHFGFRVVILNLKSDEDIKVVEGGAPQVVAATPTDLMRFK
jgi:hypothetical protein